MVDFSQSERVLKIGIEAVSCMRSCCNEPLVLLPDDLFG